VISAIIPTLNEEAGIAGTVRAVSAQAGILEVLVVDGGSSDSTVARSRRAGATVILAERGRGRQMHAGALAARGGVLWFIHADTRPIPGVSRQLAEALASPAVVGGNFTLVFDGATLGARVLNLVQPLMQRIGCYYGDSTIFVRRDAYFAAGGFPPYPVFEDAALIARLRSAGKFVSLPGQVITSSRRLERHGFVRTCARWSALQCLFWLGVPPERLARYYAPVRRDEGEEAM
jgi:rSAM/selenodomain-associated transferase 2